MGKNQVVLGGYQNVSEFTNPPSKGLQIITIFLKKWNIDKPCNCRFGKLAKFAYVALCSLEPEKGR